MPGKKTTSMFATRARIIKALAHPARLLVVDALGEGPLCVCEIRALVGSDISTVSKHLLVLRNAGIVSDEKRGLQVYYSLRCPCVTDFFACAEKVLKSTAGIRAPTSRRGPGARGKMRTRCC